MPTVCQHFHELGLIAFKPIVNNKFTFSRGLCIRTKAFTNWTLMSNELSTAKALAASSKEALPQIQTESGFDSFKSIAQLIHQN